MNGRVLSVAGSDSGGGAGIQADIKTVMALGGYAMTAVTAVTAQDTLGVHEVLPVPAGLVARQIRLVLDDIGADAVKTGMLGGADIVRAVADVLQGRALPLVVDPVMVAKGGAGLLADDALAVLRQVLLPLATLVTPNIGEAEALQGDAIPDHAAALRAASALHRQCGAAILLKGGHLPGALVQDILVHGGEPIVFTRPRLPGLHTHGTGCTLASAIATGLAQGMTLPDAVARARDYVQAAIAAAPRLGRGHGPLEHRPPCAIPGMAD